jgi:hypothetical protein
MEYGGGVTTGNSSGDDVAARWSRPTDTRIPSVLFPDTLRM